MPAIALYQDKLFLECRKMFANFIDLVEDQYTFKIPALTFVRFTKNPQA